MDSPTLEELQRTRTELDSRVNSLQLAMNSLRNEMNLFDHDDNEDGVNEDGIGEHGGGNQRVESHGHEESGDETETSEGRQRPNGRSSNAAGSEDTVEPTASSGIRDPRPFDPVRLRRGQISLLDSPPTPSVVDLLAATELRPPPSADELDRSYRNFIQDRLSFSPLPGQSGATDEEASLSTSSSSPSTPLASNGSSFSRNHLHLPHFQSRRLPRSLSDNGFDLSLDYARPNPTIQISPSTSVPSSAFTTRRVLVDQLSNRNPALETQSTEEMLERVDETAMDLMDVRTSLQERSQSIRDLDGVPRVRVLNETLRNGVNLIDQLEGRLGVVRNRLVGLSPSRRRESPSSVHVDVLPAPPRSFSIRPPQLRRGEFPRLGLSPPSRMVSSRIRSREDDGNNNNNNNNNSNNSSSSSNNNEEVLFSASPDPIHPIPPVFSSRPDTFSDWVSTGGMPTSASTAIYAYSPYTSTNHSSNNTATTANTNTTSTSTTATATTGSSAVTNTELTNSSPLSSPISAPEDSTRPPSHQRLQFNSNMAYASPSLTAVASDRTRTMGSTAQWQEVRDRNNYMWRGGDDGISFGEEIGGLRRPGSTDRVTGGLVRQTRQDRGGRRNRPWDLEGHGVSERAEEDWPELAEAGNSAGNENNSLHDSYSFDAPRDLSRTSLFARSASEDPTLTVSLPNQTLRRELLLSGQATSLSSARQGNHDLSVPYQTSPPLAFSASQSSYNTAVPSNLLNMPSSDHPVRLPTRRFEIHSFPGPSSTDPPNPMMVADRIHEDILLCERRRIAEAQRRKEEDEKKAATGPIDWMQCEGDHGGEPDEEWVVRPGPVDLPDMWRGSTSGTKSRLRKSHLDERGVKRSGEEIRRGGAKVVLIETRLLVGR